ncbi:MAG: Hsp20/alpha crystallin family protein [Candidatus Kariarchaeaceae archaeon]
MGRHRQRMRYMRRAPVAGGHWRLRQLRQFNFGFQYEEDQKLRVVVPLPGIAKDGLQVKAKENLLSISAKVRSDLERYSVRPQDSWDIILDAVVMPDTAKAKYHDGVLLVDIDLKNPSTDVTDIDFE